MVGQVFEGMFVLALVALPATVVIGVLLAFIGPRHARAVTHVPRTVGA